MVARLKAGVTLEQARAEMNTISDRLAQQYPKDDKGWGATAIPLRQDIVGDVRTPLLILLGAVAFVLLIACANIANLVLAKTLSRRKEIAIRTALGASRRQAVATGAGGNCVAVSVRRHCGASLRALRNGVHREIHGSAIAARERIGLDGWVLAFTLGISLITGLAAGLLPALRLTREDVNEALKQGLGRTAADSEWQPHAQCAGGC